MIGLRQTANGLMVHGTRLSWNKIGTLYGSCRSNGGQLMFGRIDQTAMWGLWCCGSWGCTDAWRPDRGLRGAEPQALGQAKVPFHDAIKKTIQELQKPECITSREWLPIIDKALEFASEQTPYAFSFYRIFPGTVITQLRSEMREKAARLLWWRQRLASEPDTKYCKGFNLVVNERIPSRDRELIQRAVMGPFVVAAGVQGATGAIDQAGWELLDTVTLHVFTKPPWYLNINYLAPIGVAAIALGIFSRVRSAPIPGIGDAAPPPEEDDEPVTSAPPTSVPPSSVSPTSSRTPVRSIAAEVNLSNWEEYKRRLRAGESRMEI